MRAFLSRHFLLYSAGHRPEFPFRKQEGVGARRRGLSGEHSWRHGCQSWRGFPEGGARRVGGGGGAVLWGSWDNQGSIGGLGRAAKQGLFETGN